MKTKLAVMLSVLISICTGMSAQALELTRGTSLAVYDDATAATTEPVFNVSWRDNVFTNEYGDQKVVPGGNRGSLTGTTAVTMAAAPGADYVTRTIESITVFNSDTASRRVSVRAVNSSTNYKIVTVTLAANDSLQYSRSAGWSVVIPVDNDISADQLLTTDTQLQLRDTAIYINSGADGRMNLVADGEIDISGGLIDINGGTNESVQITPGSGAILDLDSSVIARPQAGPTAKTTAATLTASEMLSGIITGTFSGSGIEAYTMPAGTDMDAGIHSDFGINDSFELTFLNLSTNNNDTIALTANTGFSLVGNTNVYSANDSTNDSSATLRVRKSAANTFIGYRID